MKLNNIFRAAVFAAGVCLVSCAPLGDAPKNIEGTCTVSGSIVAEGFDEGGASSARTATWTNGNFTYSVSAKPQTGDEVTATVTEGKFSLALDYGKWTITAKAQKENGDYLSESVTVELTTENSVAVKNFVLRGVNDGTANGKINLSLNAPNTISKVETKLVSGNSSQWESKVTSVTNGSTTTIASEGIKSGEYEVQLLFYKTSAAGDELVFATTQMINVYNNMTTDRWFDDGSYKTEDGGTGLFVGTPAVLTVTDEMMDAFAVSTFYVCGEGSENHSIASDSNFGSFFKPLATLEAAVGKCTDSNREYTIFADGTFTLTDTLTLDKNIRLNGMNGAVTFNWSPTVTKSNAISISGNVSFTNLILEGNKKDSCGIYISAQNKTVRMSNVIVRNFDSPQNGTQSGGISVNDGTLVMKGCSITDCTTKNGTGGGGVYVSSTSEAELNGCSIIRCKALKVSGGSSSGGGGISSSGTLTLKKTNISSCSSSTNGGAIYIDGGTASIDANSVIGKTDAVAAATSESCSNKAEWEGGGIYLHSGTLTNSGKIIYNYSTLGGGIYQAGGTFTHTGSIDGNCSPSAGGAVCIGSGTMEMEESGSVGANVQNDSGADGEATFKLSSNSSILKVGGAITCKEIIEIFVDESGLGKIQLTGKLTGTENIKIKENVDLVDNYAVTTSNQPYIQSSLSKFKFYDSYTNTESTGVEFVDYEELTVGTYGASPYAIVGPQGNVLQSVKHYITSADADKSHYAIHISQAALGNDPNIALSNETNLTLNAALSKKKRIIVIPNEQMTIQAKRNSNTQFIFFDGVTGGQDLYLEFRNLIFDGNKANRFDGYGSFCYINMHSPNVELTFNNCVIQNFKSGMEGGAFDVASGKVNLKNQTVVQYNRTTQTNSSNAGGVYVHQSAYLYMGENCHVERNEAGVYGKPNILVYDSATFNYSGTTYTNSNQGDVDLIFNL